nr:hypothetical protein [Tanacetum cinerariifolium]
MDNRKRIVNLKYFREMMHICPRPPRQTFNELPFEEEILAFLRFLGHNGEIRKLNDVNINKLHQPWRSFTAVINKCLNGKSTAYDSLRLSQAQILWVMYHKNNVDFAYLMWEDFVYQVEHKDAKKSNEMYYLMFTKAQDSQLLQKANNLQRPPKQKSLTLLSEVAMTKAEQIKLAMKRSLQQTHISQASGSSADEGTVIQDDDDDQDEGNDDDQDTDNEDDESNDDASLSLNVGSEEGQDAGDDEDELYRDVNINLEGKDVQMTDVHTTQEFEDTHVTLTLMDVPTSTSVVSFTLTALTLPPPTIPASSQVQQAPTPPTTAPSTLLQDLPNFGSAVSSIPRIVQRYMDQWMNEADKIIKEQVKEQVSKILPKIEKTVNEQLEAEVLTRSSNSSKTSYVALVEAYESDKIILDTYGDTVTLKRSRDDANKDEDPSTGSDRGSKRRRKGKEPESTSATKEKVTKTTGKSTQGSKSQQKTASESAPAEEPMQTTQDLEEPSHQEFETRAADDQPIAEASQHPECFQQ